MLKKRGHADPSTIRYGSHGIRSEPSQHSIDNSALVAGFQPERARVGGATTVWPILLAAAVRQRIEEDPSAVQPVAVIDDAALRDLDSFKGVLQCHGVECGLERSRQIFGLMSSARNLAISCNQVAAAVGAEGGAGAAGGEGGGGVVQWGVSVLQAISICQEKSGVYGDAVILMYWWDAVFGLTGDIGSASPWLSEHLFPAETSEHVLDCTFACTFEGCQEWCRTLRTPAADNPRIEICDVQSRWHSMAEIEDRLPNNGDTTPSTTPGSDSLSMVASVSSACSYGSHAGDTSLSSDLDTSNPSVGRLLLCELNLADHTAVLDVTDSMSMARDDEQSCNITAPHHSTGGDCQSGDEAFPLTLPLSPIRGGAQADHDMYIDSPWQ